MIPKIALLLALLPISAFPQSSSAASPTQTNLRAKLEETIRDVDSRLDGAMGVAIVDLTNGDSIMLHADDVFPTASSIKVAVLAELYRQTEQSEQGQQGKAKLTDVYRFNKADDVPDSSIFNGLTPDVTTLTLRDVAQIMVAVSDNSATNVLIDRLGMQNVTQLMQSLSLNHIKLQRKMMDLGAAKAGRENLATPREFSALFEALYRHKVLSAQHSDEMLKLLETRKDSPMQRAFMYNVRVADKHGELDGIRCDVGIIYAPNRPFAISIMTSYLKNEREGEEAISEISQAAYQYFDRVGRSSPYGRAMQPPSQP